MLQTIVDDLLAKKILPKSFRYWSELKGGTDSTVGIIGSPDSSLKYVVKLNRPEQIASENTFYELYHGIALLPKVTYVDPGYRYFLYRYVPGATSYVRGTKETLMHELIERVIRYYVPPTSETQFPWVEDPERAKEDLDYARSIIATRLAEDDHHLVAELLARRRARIDRDRLYVLHGDFGVHNFLFEQGTLSGVIDPIPSLGRPLYDLLYAFCSSPDDLHRSVLVSAVERMGGNETIHESDLVDDTIIALYMRLSTCLRHHPNDWHEYLKAWNEWVH